MHVWYSVHFFRKRVVRLAMGYTFEVILVLVTVYLSELEASLGDRSVDFRRCVSACVYKRCRSSSAAAEGELALSLKALGWSCEENCRYDCMHDVTGEDVALDRPIRQFYGKVG